MSTTPDHGRKFKKQKIKIAYLAGIEKAMVEIDAKVCEGVAYHRKWLDPGFGRAWKVTHVGTGFSFGGCFASERKARDVAIKILDTGVDLTLLNKYGQGKGRRIPKFKCYEPIREILKAWQM